MANSSKKFKDRVDFVAAGYQYTHLLIETKPWMAAYLKGGQKDEKLAQKVRDNFVQITALPEKYPFLISPRQLRPGSKRMRNAHPDHLPKMAAGADGSSVLIAMPASDATGTPAFKTAKDAGWKLAFSDDFDREKLGDNWLTPEGAWSIKEGELHGTNGYILTAKPIVVQGRPTFQRIEFDATTTLDELKSIGDDATSDASVTPCDISPLIQCRLSDNPKAGPTKQGYFFQFGAYWNTVNRIRMSGMPVFRDDNPSIIIKPNVKQHIVAENDYGHLKLYVNGELVYHLRQKSTLVGADYNRAGIYLTTASKIDNVRVYVKAYEDGLDTE